jgi:hypothetical protein
VVGLRLNHPIFLSEIATDSGLKKLLSSFALTNLDYSC